MISHFAKVGVEGSNPFARSNDFNALGDMALSFQKRGCSVRFKQRSDWNARSKILEIQCLRWL
jgi:hypothetical protein